MPRSPSRLPWAAALVAVFLVAAPAGAAGDPVGVRLRMTATEAVVELRIAAGWHVNANQPHDDFLVPTTVSFTPPPGLLVGAVAWPPPGERTLAFSGGKPMLLYEGTVRLPAPLAGTPAAGAPPLTATVRYQPCSDTTCLPPKTVEVAAEPAGREPAASAGPSGRNEIEAFVERFGWGLTFAWVALVGLALNLTPCVYPMISVTIAFFGGRTGDDAARAVRHALLYLLGICLAFSALGAAAALTGSLFGAAMQQPWVLGAIALLMVGLALANFGVYQLRMPAGVLQWAGRGGEGALGALFMGLTMGIVGAPCIGPIVAALLLFVGAQQSVPLGLALFFVLGLGLGLPYVALAMMAGRLRRVMPRGGAWLGWMEWLFGFVLLGIALHFATPLLPDAAVRIAWALVFGAAGVALGFLDWGPGPALRRVRQVAGAFAVVVGVSGLVVAEPESRIAWVPLSDAALASATAERRPVLIDFQAEWCLPCREMERTTFQDPAVVRAAEAFSALKADVTAQDAEAEALMARWGTPGVPTYVILGRDGRERRRFVGYVGADELLAGMQDAAGEATPG